MPTTVSLEVPFAAKRLASVFSPEIVGVPPTNAIRELMLLPSGEIRHYGFRGNFREGEIENIFLSSPDHGFSWLEKEAPPFCPGATVRSPWSGDYFTVLPHHGRTTLEEFHSIHAACPTPGIYLHRSTHGPDGPFETIRVADLLPRLLMPRQPLALTTRNRWIIPAQAAEEKEARSRALVFLSDDDGFTWRPIFLPPLPRHGAPWPHQGPRWEECGEEPTVVELSDGRLFMLIRTAHDEFWESFSPDGGETWTTPAPSRFYGTITSPLLFKLSDGRLLVIWNNTTPLPEVDHATQPGLHETERTGVYEDVFTNRDALHAAISEDDGQSWIGFRELYLNERRNDADFRSRGGNHVSLDKSVHQSQAVELPGGKVLLAFGQHPLCRRLLVFDPDWLYETTRSDDFLTGLEGWSYHQFLKSVPGNFRGFAGHCAVNRRPGAALMPHPDGIMREVLRIARDPDPRLLEEKQGAVWNFPNATAGRLRLRLRLPSGSAGLQICLLDRWFNPTDPVVASFAQFALTASLTREYDGRPLFLADHWHWLEITWNLQPTPTAAYRVDEGPLRPLTLQTPTRNGISYVHLQSAATGADPAGGLIEQIEMRALE